MWVFGYGSLMWDGWEKQFGCSSRCIAVLRGYQRTFNKASTKNRGTKRHPCPTLNLEECEGGTCKGAAFEFPDDKEEAIRKYLEKREGEGFSLERLSVRLPDDSAVSAHVPIYAGKNLISSLNVEEKAVMVGTASGTMSSCADYVKEIAGMLADLGIEDQAVSELWRKVQTHKGTVREAKAIVVLAFRNGPIEELHAGKPCSACEGKSGYSRISDAEMKVVMKNAVNRVYKLLRLKADDPEGYERQIAYGERSTANWDDPE
jgi:cation transport protein ChaC